MLQHEHSSAGILFSRLIQSAVPTVTRTGYVGRNVPTAAGEEIKVQMKEIDATDAVYLLELAEGGDDAAA